MQNGIIVPLSGAFIASAIGPTASDPQLDVSGATWVANTGSPVSLAATGGSGTGAVFNTVFTGSDMAGTTITATAGTGYKVGDVLTIAGNATNFTGSIVLTVQEEDLLGDESEGFITSLEQVVFGLAFYRLKLEIVLTFFTFLRLSQIMKEYGKSPLLVVVQVIIMT